MTRSGRRDSNLGVCVEAAAIFHLDAAAARGIIDSQIDRIEESWDEVCDAAGLAEVERLRLRRGAVLHPSVRYGY